MTFFLTILLAHLLGDFGLQPAKWVKDKMQRKHRSPKLYFHIGIHALLLLVLLSFDFQYWLGILIIVVSHLLIDILKINLQGKYNSRLLFFGDQFLHILVLIGVTQIYFPDFINFPALWSENLLLLATAVSLLTFVSSILIKVLISNWSPATEDDKDDSLAKAGTYIGMLERLFVFGFVISGHWEAIGFLIAAKSVFRFGDLKESKDRKLTEYILIGTLVSFGIAILVGVLFIAIQE
ncbi:Protein of unknown function (DUF3307) [Owenweeksia hongkongensis DSM 17368]|uniref:DUF3307 domain-containing protein n=1 Tax=Owenweeksia hongkongensis (strain DSM 17368 / CIP 108786 / JCM 12287 / NRRL B-23963 / UST20020801) TaxID=926562 RepID=G8R274_OWEHD|nr:DUF3307 domain-containing protein [Owenweeksia hongkongensis]AEV31824.1 Protein of unknown function (DUF3307) [Owenweeksia hongkongensis DSM 17368]